jgi:diguanylate cyclase (GGDEF)-like protein
MASRQRDDESLAAEWMALRELTLGGQPEQAFELVERVIAGNADPYRVAQALVGRLLLIYTTGNRDSLPPLLQQVEEQLRAAPHPRLLGQYRQFAANLAHDHRSYSIALLHIVNGERALERMAEGTQAAAAAWDDLGTTYSRLGYHTRALEAHNRARSLSAELGRPSAIDTLSIAALHAAVYLDQRGDTDGCIRQLNDLVEQGRPLVQDLTVLDRVVLGYAVRRLATLDQPVALDVPATGQVGPVLSQINTLGEVCKTLAGQNPERALGLLDTATSPLNALALGTAEPLRLRSLALVRLGDYAGAMATERAVLLMESLEERELRTLLADGAGAQIDQHELRHSAERHARAALTDPLTGLPNRRKLDEFTTRLSTTGTPAAIGMLDLDCFKAVNDNHGHPTGDIVLQRTAGILARELGPNDLVAHTGGDEFVIVLPNATKTEADTVGQRIEAAVSNEDWFTLVPNIPVAISTGWAQLDGDVNAATRAADAALYATKREHRARS